jgi:hypothetical protein
VECRKVGNARKTSLEARCPERWRASDARGLKGTSEPEEQVVAVGASGAGEAVRRCTDPADPSLIQPFSRRVAAQVTGRRRLSDLYGTDWITPAIEERDVVSSELDQPAPRAAEAAEVAALCSHSRRSTYRFDRVQPLGAD